MQIRIRPEYVRALMRIYKELEHVSKRLDAINMDQKVLDVRGIAEEAMKELEALRKSDKLEAHKAIEFERIMKSLQDEMQRCEVESTPHFQRHDELEEEAMKLLEAVQLDNPGLSLAEAAEALKVAAAP